MPPRSGSGSVGLGSAKIDCRLGRRVGRPRHNVALVTPRKRKEKNLLLGQFHVCWLTSFPLEGIGRGLERIGRRWKAWAKTPRFWSGSNGSLSGFFDLRRLWKASPGAVDAAVEHNRNEKEKRVEARRGRCLAQHGRFVPTSTGTKSSARREGPFAQIDFTSFFF
jgi:hypothetical protein